MYYTITLLIIRCSLSAAASDSAGLWKLEIGCLELSEVRSSRLKMRDFNPSMTAKLGLPFRLHLVESPWDGGKDEDCGCGARGSGLLEDHEAVTRCSEGVGKQEAGSSSSSRVSGGNGGDCQAAQKTAMVQFMCSSMLFLCSITALLLLLPIVLPPLPPPPSELMLLPVGILLLLLCAALSPRS